MAGPLMFLKILALCFAIALPTFLIAYAAWLNRCHFSRLLDRFKVRPSQVKGVAQITGGLLCFSVVCTLPMTIVVPLMIYGVGAAVTIALGVEKLWRPPMQEYRPSWYVGDGNPEWLLGPRRLSAPRISLSFIGVAMLVLCVCLTVFSSRLRESRIEQEQQSQAIVKVEQFGGTVQQETVSLAGTKVTDEDLSLLTELKIRVLNLGATNISNAGLEHVGQLSSIEELILSGTSIDDEGLARLVGLRKLRTLRLRKTKVTGTAFPINSAKRRGRLPRLILDLSLCPITEEGLRCIAKTKHLLHLDLCQTDVDDSMLESLFGVDTTSIDISQTNVTQAGFEKLQAALPNANVIWSESPLARQGR